MKKNKQLLVFTHLSQLLDYVTGIGGFIVPLVIWLTNRDKVEEMDEQGKSILNFRISMFLYLILCVPMILFFGLGLLGFLVIGIFYFIFPILNAIKVNNGEEPNYPFSIEFIK
ncbi:MAG: tRNA modification GTPase [Lutibacter sp.]|nr:MAG: tRNA modification GTPase [Lutibacter sp.]